MAYALFYWWLNDTQIWPYLVFYRVGMPPEYYDIIATVHMIMSSIHGSCIVLMAASSVWLRKLVFTPWGDWRESKILKKSTGTMQILEINTKNANRANSELLKWISKLSAQIISRHGILGVNGQYFHVIAIFREFIETALQTIQAYRMSSLLPNALLNRFYVVGIVLNCWSPVVIHAFLFRRDEARKRFASLASDSMLDLFSCMGVTFIIVLNYVGQYTPETADFGLYPWYNDEWAAKALNEFQMVLVVSWSDLATRVLFSLGLLMAITNMKELLYPIPRHGNRVVGFKEAVLDSPSKTKVLSLHIQASVQPSLQQCTLQVRPWAVKRPYCFLISLDCHRLQISGQLEEIDIKWREFDGSTVVMMVIKHCPLVDIPDTFNEFHQLISVKVYNSTIVEWRESAAITNTNHPAFLSLMLVRTNMTNGELPAGFQSSDPPLNLYDYEFCITNLREVPDDLDVKWLTGSYVIIEYSQLQTVPQALLRVNPSYFSLTGNPISELPPEIFEIEGLTDLGIGDTNIRELPHNVTQLSSTLTSIYVEGTSISYFWSWTDEILGRESVRNVPRAIYAGNTVYCGDLEKILTKSANSFSAVANPDFSSRLMNPPEAGLEGNIWSFVDCNPAVSGLSGPLYPLAAEDNQNVLHS
ncbi:hypothetical protein AM587_10010638 [Phytophthora nicotianae]|uniref:Uncharacterized protein n=2 Tax=Phytophthora nicotianae TaxID=4792 RepID=A0A0W8C728_PHYNI|nr:hypothetical protein AM587_10010638 [Phytophthora nicotianae]